MEQKVIIEPNRSYLRKGKKVISTINTDLLSRRMFHTTPYSDELLPQFSRYFIEVSNHLKIFVLEYPPQERTIKLLITHGARKKQFKNLIGDEKKADQFLQERKRKDNVFSLLFPYTIFIIKVYEYGGTVLKVYFRNEPLTSLNDDLFKVPIFNIGFRQTMCQPFPNSDETEDMPRSKLVEYAVNSFWNSSFCSDLRGNMQAYACKNKKLNFSNYFWWEYLTVTDPIKILTNEWIPAHTLKTSINDFLGTEFIQKVTSEGFEKLKLNFKY